jgi:hypothetical protein
MNPKTKKALGGMETTSNRILMESTLINKKILTMAFSGIHGNNTKL